MTVQDAIRARKSVRSFEDRPVPEETLARVLEAARLAPSAKNVQEWRFVVVTDEALRTRIAEASGNQKFVGKAPVVIVACAETDRRVMSCGHLAFLIDVAIAIDHLTLAATEEGLGTCWIGAFDPGKIRQILGIPSEIEVVEVLPLGYPADPSIKQKDRLPASEIVHRERW
jgi:nitroreductase